MQSKKLQRDDNRSAARQCPAALFKIPQYSYIIHLNEDHAVQDLFK